VAILFGSGGRVLKGTKQVATVETWSIDQGGGSATDWSGGLTATWDVRPELGGAAIELTDGSGTWTGQVTITDLPFRLPADRKAEIGFQGNGALERK
jgi:hypothetical protein